MDKVKITQEQADVLEIMKAKGAPLNEIIERHVHKDHIRVNGYGLVEQMPIDTLIRALYIGYEVEKTPEDKVRAMFKKLATNGNDSFERGLNEGYLGGILDTLSALNIKIVGVNHD